MIESSLSARTDQFNAIVNKFVERLGERVTEMEKALQEDNLEELARLAHWLKGSAGTVGFDSFFEPALELEQAAKAGDTR